RSGSILNRQSSGPKKLTSPRRISWERSGAVPLKINLDNEGSSNTRFFYLILLNTTKQDWNMLGSTLIRDCVLICVLQVVGDTPRSPFQDHPLRHPRNNYCAQSACSP